MDNQNIQGQNFDPNNQNLNPLAGNNNPATNPNSQPFGGAPANENKGDNFSNPFAGFDQNPPANNPAPQTNVPTPVEPQVVVPETPAPTPVNENPFGQAPQPVNNFDQPAPINNMPAAEPQATPNVNQGFSNPNFNTPNMGNEVPANPPMPEMNNPMPNNPAPNNFPNPVQPLNGNNSPQVNTGFDPNVFEDEELEEKPKSNKTLLLVGLVFVLIALAAGAYIYFFVLNKAPTTPKSNTPVTSITTTTKSPEPFVELNGAVKSDMQISLSNSELVKEYIQSKALENLEEAGTIKIIQPTIKSLFLNNLEVLTSLISNTPETILQNLNEQYTLYTYYGEERPTLGLILSLKPGTTETISQAMTDWEDSETLLKSTANLWLFTNKTTKEKVFKNTDINGATARCFGFTEKEAELCYLVHNDYFLITTSTASLTKAYDSLFGSVANVAEAPVASVPEEVPQEEMLEAPLEEGVFENMEEIPS